MKAAGNSGTSTWPRSSPQCIDGCKEARGLQRLHADWGAPPDQGPCTEPALAAAGGIRRCPEFKDECKTGRRLRPSALCDSDQLGADRDVTLRRRFAVLLLHHGSLCTDTRSCPGSEDSLN